MTNDSDRFMYLRQDVGDDEATRILEDEAAEGYAVGQDPDRRRLFDDALAENERLDALPANRMANTAARETAETTAAMVLRLKDEEILRLRDEVDRLRTQVRDLDQRAFHELREQHRTHQRRLRHLHHTLTRIIDSYPTGGRGELVELRDGLYHRLDPDHDGHRTNDTPEGR